MPNPSPEQEEILEHDATEHGRVLAGPGTGKSWTAVRLLRRLRQADGDLAVRLVTFTRAATQDLAQQVQEAQLEVPPPTTVHSLALSLLMRNRNATDLPRPLRIPDEHEQAVIQSDIARRLRMQGHDITVRQVRKLEREMSARWEALADEWVQLADLEPELRQAYVGQWERHREIYGYTLLAEIPYRAGLALEDFEPDIGDIDFLLVDEYQDLNRADIRFLEELADRGIALLAIGDDDQSIYSFRMAAPDGILAFPETFETQNLYSLTRCFRCGSEILEPATALIQASPDRRRQRDLMSFTDEDGQYIYARFESEVHEAQGVAEMIQARLDAGVTPRDIVVLVRSSVSAWANLLSPELEERGIELVNTDWVDEIMERARFRDRLEVLRLAASEGWTEESIAWWLLLRQWNGVAQSFRDYIYDHAVAETERFAEALLRLVPDFQGAPTTRSANAAADAVEHYQDRARQLRENADAAELGEFGWGGWILEQFNRESFAEDEVSLLERVGQYLSDNVDGLAGFLSQLQPVAKDLATQASGVRIMTMTKSKGLTVDTAFIMGVEEGVIPKPDARDPEEERRLLYVATTRPTQLAVLSFAYRREDRTAHIGEGAPGAPRGRSPLLRQLPGEMSQWIPGDQAVEEVVTHGDPDTEDAAAMET